MRILNMHTWSSQPHQVWSCFMCMTASGDIYIYICIFFYLYIYRYTDIHIHIHILHTSGAKGVSSKAIATATESGA